MDEVNQPLTDSQTPSVVPPQEPQLKQSVGKKLLILAGVLVIAVALGGAFFLRAQKATTPPSTNSVDETANWKTYTGTKVVFKYPPDLYVVTGEQYGDPDVIAIVENPQTDYRAGGFTIDASLKNNPYYSDYNKTISTLEQGLINMQTKTTQNGGLEMFGQTDPNGHSQGAGTHARYAIFQYGEGAIVVTSPQEHGLYLDDSTFTRIVSTFKFTGQTTDTSNWKTYTNTKYAFTLQYPANSTIESRNDTEYQYIRLQNYTDKDVISRGGKLVAGEYYLEIFIYDNEQGNKIPKSCTESLTNAKAADLGAGITGYRGNGLGGGDSAPYIIAICASRQNVDYLIHVSEFYETIASKIANSFKFTQ